ncbi:flavin-containing monooxygenase [Kordiimonas aquimaris]|uniref:flavin-containing monooxygenase n=1 Tax=Kordiimonas aquimaris TaxID=707591 RepID=UPI0021D2B0D5|nr:NAD(P)/FAD-dependent oxidoreductase [Kordiimonas aquimaris]
MSERASPTIAIIGSGLAGMCMGIQLKKAGIDSFIIFEKADEVGGTWRENTYPGVACDVPSHLYSYSFEPNSNWSHVFSPGAEIQEYALHCAKKYDLYPHLKFGHALVSAIYEDGWKLTFENGHTETFDFLINGIGGLHVPSFPDIPGLEAFNGAKFHSAQWDHDHDLTGKNVAVVGTAASALQLIPEIVDKVKSLTVFQRTPNWIRPRMDESYRSSTKKRFQRFDFMRALHRLRIYLMLESNWPAFKNNRVFQALARRVMMKHLEEQVPDEDLRAKLTPDYPVGCKRILISDDYFPAIQRSNVTFVTDGIDKIEKDHLIDANGAKHAVDTLILATGFKPFSLLENLEITGPDGTRMTDYFTSGGIRAHNTVWVPGFPNFAMLVGPNSGLGHNSIILMIEAQVNYIIGCIKATLQKEARTIDARKDIAQRFDDKVQHELEDTVWHTNCKSWYVGDDGRNYTLWSGTTLRYRRLLSRVDLDDFVFEK